MILSIDFSSEVPIYQQIRNEIVIGIARGALRSGDRLPSIRALADESGVNMMTVSKAYQLLKQEGYITTDRQRGALVCANSDIKTVPQETLMALRLHLSELRLCGLSTAEALALCEKLYKEDV